MRLSDNTLFDVFEGSKIQETGIDFNKNKIFQKLIGHEKFIQNHIFYPFKTFGCLELSIATLQNFDGRFVVKTDAGYEIKDISDFNPDEKPQFYATEELLKLLQLDKIFNELNVKPNEFFVKNTKGESQTLENYRRKYQDCDTGHNKQLNMRFCTRGRVSNFRKDSQEDLENLSKVLKDKLIKSSNYFPNGINFNPEPNSKKRKIDDFKEERNNSKRKSLTEKQKKLLLINNGYVL